MMGIGGCLIQINLCYATYITVNIREIRLNIHRFMHLREKCEINHLILEGNRWSIEWIILMEFFSSRIMEQSSMHEKQFKIIEKNKQLKSNYVVMF